jgi:hypothetical protein
LLQQVSPLKRTTRPRVRPEFKIAEKLGSGTLDVVRIS